MGGNSNLCSAVSYFSTLLGSIIGAGRLSFRVRDGTGRFPAAMAAVTLFTRFWVPPRVSLVGGVCFGGGVCQPWGWLCPVWCGCGRLCASSFAYTGCLLPTGVGVCKFSAG